MSSFESVLSAVGESKLTGFELRSFAMAGLSELDGYNWCGIYRLDGDTLVLDAYVGAHTDHTHIPVGRGVCGTAVAENKNQVIPDVCELTNYLSCSLETRSEIVVLIRRGNHILGQIDIDGHSVGTFRSNDEEFLESLGKMLAQNWD
ncbi:MAG: GAF domain-containing protein [Armatimonadetes bacterium]|nr:GAF domain-containing protein [Armatimonadota bacterium]